MNRLRKLFVLLCSVSVVSPCAFAQPAQQLRPALPSQPSPPPKSAKREHLSAELREHIKALDTKKAYGGELHRQQSPENMGGVAPNPVPPDQETEAASHDTTGGEYILMERPKLRALVSFNRKVSPFSLDSEWQQQVTMRDVLLNVSSANLDILISATNAETNRWFWRSALTDFLPNINSGFNEIGLNSISAIPIKATAQAIGSGVSPTTVQSLATKTIVDTPLTVLQTGFTWKPIQGGLVFSALEQKHRLKASRAQLRADISDALLGAANDYYDLVYNEALLEIRTAAVRTDEEQVRQNMSLEESGLATNLDVLQAKTQLSKDMQNLADQQRARRAAAIKLAHDMNFNLGEDLLPAENTLRPVRLIATDLPINHLLSIAIDHRPELKQYEELRLAAKRQIGFQASQALPTVQLGGSIIGLESKIGPMYPTYMLNFGINWKMDGLGLKSYTNTQGARWQARRVMLEANKELLDVLDQVRNAYNTTLSTEVIIDQSTSEVLSAEEELRLARMRLDNGLGTNLDVLTAQRDLTEARLHKALSLMNYNKAQAQLLHDIGLISIDNLSAGLLVSAKSH